MFELIIWDWDEESSYFVHSRCFSDDNLKLLRKAKAEADPEEDGVYVGAWVYKDGKPINGYGFNPGYIPGPPALYASRSNPLGPVV